MNDKTIPTKHKYQNGDIIQVCDVVEIDGNIYTVRSDEKFHYINKSKPTIWSTNKPIKKLGTIEEFPEYFI